NRNFRSYGQKESNRSQGELWISEYPQSFFRRVLLVEFREWGKSYYNREQDENSSKEDIGYLHSGSIGAFRMKKVFKNQESTQQWSDDCAKRVHSLRQIES